MSATCRLCPDPAVTEGLCASCALKAIRAARRQDRRRKLEERPAGPPPVDRFLLPAEVADRLRVDRSTVYKLLREGKLRGIRVGRRVNVKASSLQSYLVGNRIRRI